MTEEITIKRLLPKCGACQASGVRIYREYMRLRNKEYDRCNECIDQKEKGWMVPCCLDAEGRAWSFGAIPDFECEIFFSLPEKSPNHPHWRRKGGWSDNDSAGF